jgi:hypothetical protein
VGVELRSGVAVDWAGGVVLELGGQELSGGLGAVVPADPRLRVPLKLCECGADGGSVCVSDSVVAAYKGGQRDGFWG